MSARALNRVRCRGLLLLALLATFVRAPAYAADFPQPGEARLVQFDASLPPITNRAPGIEYNFDLVKESFAVFVPGDYADREPFGLFVFMGSQDMMAMPETWRPVMERQKLICVIPQRIGNEQPFARRLGLTVVGIFKAAEHYAIDRHRIYVGGFSGGARCAVQLAFSHNELVAGDVSICGANFYEPVPQVKVTEKSDYGVWPVPAAQIAAAKGKVRFAFITGSRDFRYANILDIYHGGFEKNGFHARLIDQPNMGHELCSPQSLEAALRFVSGKD